jgi:hypothetical protein
MFVPWLAELSLATCGRYQLQHLIEERGRNGKLIKWLDEITADCPKNLGAQHERSLRRSLS